MLDKSEIRNIRLRWKSSRTKVDKAYWALEYAKVRYARACHFGGGKRGRAKWEVFPRAQKARAAFWQKVHGSLENLMLVLSKDAHLTHFAWSQSFEFAPRAYAAQPARSIFGEHTLNIASLSQFPQDWKELADPSGPAADAFFADPDDPEEESDDEGMSWAEFYQRICAFEEKIKAQREAGRVTAPLD
jgi:hypothetical protein